MIITYCLLVALLLSFVCSAAVTRTCRWPSLLLALIHDLAATRTCTSESPCRGKLYSSALCWPLPPVAIRPRTDRIVHRRVPTRSPGLAVASSAQAAWQAVCGSICLHLVGNVPGRWDCRCAFGIFTKVLPDFQGAGFRGQEQHRLLVTDFHEGKKPGLERILSTGGGMVTAVTSRRWSAAMLLIAVAAVTADSLR